MGIKILGKSSFKMSIHWIIWIKVSIQITVTEMFSIQINQNFFVQYSIVQFKSLFIVHPHINTTYKGRTFRSLVQCPIGLTGNEDYNIVTLFWETRICKIIQDTFILVHNITSQSDLTKKNYQFCWATFSHMNRSKPRSSML